MLERIKRACGLDMDYWRDESGRLLKHMQARAAGASPVEWQQLTVLFYAAHNEFRRAIDNFERLGIIVLIVGVGGLVFLLFMATL